MKGNSMPRPDRILLLTMAIELSEGLEAMLDKRSQYPNQVPSSEDKLILKRCVFLAHELAQYMQYQNEKGDA